MSPQLQNALDLIVTLTGHTFPNGRRRLIQELMHHVAVAQREADRANCGDPYPPFDDDPLVVQQPEE